MSKILLLGGAGFLGFHLGTKLSELGNKVTSLDNFSHTCGAVQTATYGDVRYYQDVAPLIKDSDTVIHLAAQINVDKSISNPEETLDTNVKGTLNVLEACRIYKKPLIFASSSEVYGSAQAEDISETHPLDAPSPYAASKVAGERLCYSYYKTYGLPVKMVRLFNTFGPWQNSGNFVNPRGGSSYGAAIAIFVARVLRNLPPIIFGTGEQERDYLWVDDAVQAYQVALESKIEGRPINFGSGKTVKIKDIARMVIEMCGKKGELEPVYSSARPGEVQKLKANITEARALGFEPKVSFEEGLSRYIDWYKTAYVELLKENEKTD